MVKPKIKSKIERYEPGIIEAKWQKIWEKQGLYKALDFDRKPKYYVLIEFPYPSGAGLHVGHVRSWSAMDAYARKKRMGGYNVLYPIGWDAFGLPAENYALKMHIHPSKIVPKNIERFKKQCKSLGFSFDWVREINTTDPKYYKWTQWIFLKFFEKGLAYRADVPVNWCPSCKTNLADEEVLADGTHERCGNPTEKRMQKQWLLKITKYADRLLEDLKKIDYSQKIAIQQVNWIGRSEGAQIEFKILNSPTSLRSAGQSKFKISVFTTRPDTLFGATFMVLAPEHPIVASLLKSKIKSQKSKLDQIKKYIGATKRKTEMERIAQRGEKTGVDTGLKAINPVNNEEIPIWIADYVVMSYGTGAIMAVPAHDERDFEFAKRYKLLIKFVIKPTKGGLEKNRPYIGPGAIINSSKDWNNYYVPDAIPRIINDLEKWGIGKRQVHYHLRDWVFSRQHYWGEPIPIIYCRKCGKSQISPASPSEVGRVNLKTQIEGEDYAIIPVPESHLPVELPYLEKYEPSGTGESPLANAKEWVNTKCPNCGGPAKRETDTMPNWAGSNWYYLAYLFANKLGKNSEFINIFQKNKKLINYWMPVDIYQGGFEHTTLHLLYSRFVYKFLYDIGVVPTPEPYAKRRSHGIVLGSDGRKMSKSFGNIINPEDIINKFGADTLRVYEMFMGPFDQTIVWSEESVEGCFRFLKRVWQLSLSKISKKKTSIKLLSKLHKTIKKVNEDLENMKFNTAVANLMKFINSWKEDKEGLDRDDLKKFLLTLAPFAPHLAEELYQNIILRAKPKESGEILRSAQNDKAFLSIHLQSWPEYERRYLKEEEVTIAVQVNGKLRDTLKILPQNLDDKQMVEEIAKGSKKVKKYLIDKTIKKTVYVKGRIINFVTGD